MGKTYDLKEAWENVKVYEGKTTTLHEITLDDQGMAVLIAALTIMLDQEGNVMTPDERLAVNKMIGEFREGLGKSRSMEAPRLQ